MRKDDPKIPTDIMLPQNVRDLFNGKGVNSTSLPSYHIPDEIYDNTVGLCSRTIGEIVVDPPKYRPLCVLCKRRYFTM